MWNGPIFEFLGLSVGVITQENKSYLYDKKFTDDSHGDERLAHLKPVSRKEAYSADIISGVLGSSIKIESTSSTIAK